MDIKKIGIYIFPDVEELDFIGVFEVLTKTRTLKEAGTLLSHHPLQVDVLASQKRIKCANGLVVVPHGTIDDFTDYDMLIIPGGRGIHVLIEDKPFLRKIKEFSKTKFIGSVCTGAFILAEAGVLKGRVATTHFNHREKLSDFCRVTNERVVIDGNVITAGGISCSLDLGLTILELIYGENVASMVAERLELPHLIKPNRGYNRAKY